MAKTERELIAEAQEAMGTLKDRLGKIALLNKEEGRDEIWLVATKRLRQLEVLHADMGLDLIKYFPDVSVRGPGR